MLGHDPKALAQFLKNVHGIFGPQQHRLALSLERFADANPSLRGDHFNTWRDPFMTHLSQTGQSDLAQVFNQLIRTPQAEYLTANKVFSESDYVGQLRAG